MNNKHNLEFEKIVDGLKNKYEAVVRIAVIANKIAEGDITPAESAAPKEKVTMAALDEYLKDNPTPAEPASSSQE